MELMPFHDIDDRIFKFIFPKTGDIAHDSKGDWYYDRGHWYFSGFPEGKTGEWVYLDNEWRFGRWSCAGGWQFTDQEPGDLDDPSQRLRISNTHPSSATHTLGETPFFLFFCEIDDFFVKIDCFFAKD